MSVARHKPKLRQNFEIASQCVIPARGTGDDELSPKYLSEFNEFEV